MTQQPTTKRWTSTLSLVLLAGSLIVVAVESAPIVVLTTQEPIIQGTVAEEMLSSGVPYEFPDDYSISLEEAVVS
jgi:hypothetical protein